MRFLSLHNVIQLHKRIIAQSGGVEGILDLGLLESALGQCKITFGGQDIYPSPAEKAAALCFSIVRNHPFVDGNKRTGHAAMEVFLVLNGYEIDAGVDETETIILRLASGAIGRDDFVDWVQAHLKAL
ncbi:MAG: type II toxin-antitoxin system death-on-curing family toxin [Pseudomonadota bacterium]